MLQFVPLHLTPLEREPLLNEFIKVFPATVEYQLLTPEGWYTDAIHEGNFIWNVPPAADGVVYEMVDRARLRRPTSMHLVFIPRLLTGRWRRLMTRRTNCYIKIDWDEVWPLVIHHEPLLMFVAFPFLCLQT